MVTRIYWKQMDMVSVYNQVGLLGFCVLYTHGWQVMTVQDLGEGFR